jgi:3',5'-cyclic AMP phosphodiesterase CpdA
MGRIALAVLALVFSTGCPIYLMRVHTPAELEKEGLPPPVDRHGKHPQTYIDEMHAAVLGQPFPADPAKIRRVRDGEKRQVVESVAPGRPLLTFFHLSDVQLRDERARLWTAAGSRIGDAAIRSFEHGECQNRYDTSLYLTMVMTLNDLVQQRTAEFRGGPPDAHEQARRLAGIPQLAAHTGDALDAGTLLELQEYLHVSRHLAVPWLQSLGNHDVNVFGNFEGREIYLGSPLQGNLIIHGTDEIALAHQQAPPLCREDLAPTPRCQERQALLAHYGGQLPMGEEDFGGYDHPVTRLFLNDALGRNVPNSGHGLSLTHALATDEKGDVLRDEPFYRGYYAFSLPKVRFAQDRGAALGGVKLAWDTGEPSGYRIVVLNTYETFDAPFGAWHEGRMTDRQLAWLEEELTDPAHGVEESLVFGHHPTDAFLDAERGERLEELFRNSRVLAYFAGHTHRHGIRFHDNGDGGFGFWEIVTAGLVEYPQQASLVTLIELPDGRRAFDVQAIGLPPLATGQEPCDFLVDRAEKECRNVAQTREPSLLEEAWCGHHGAREDASRKDLLTRLTSPFRDELAVDDFDRTVRLIVPRKR